MTQPDTGPIPNTVYNTLWESLARTGSLQLYVPNSEVERVKRGISRAKTRSNRKLADDREHGKLSFTVDSIHPGELTVNQARARSLRGKVLLTCFIESVTATIPEDEATDILAASGIYLREADNITLGTVALSDLVDEDEFNPALDGDEDEGMINPFSGTEHTDLSALDLDEEDV